MNCHLCKTEAVTRCFTCGALVCAEHCMGDVCPSCGAGIVAGDPRGFSVGPVATQQGHGWWRPQQADEYTPPGCYACQALTRAVCRNCQSRFCRDHAGFNGLCKECAKSANLGLYVLLFVAGLFALIFLLQWLFRT